MASYIKYRTSKTMAVAVTTPTGLQTARINANDTFEADLDTLDFRFKGVEGTARGLDKVKGIWYDEDTNQASTPTPTPSQPTVEPKAKTVDPSKKVVGSISSAETADERPKPVKKTAMSIKDSIVKNAKTPKEAVQKAPEESSKRPVIANNSWKIIPAKAGTRQVSGREKDDTDVLFDKAQRDTKVSKAFNSEATSSKIDQAIISDNKTTEKPSLNNKTASAEQVQPSTAASGISPDKIAKWEAEGFNSMTWANKKSYLSKEKDVEKLQWILDTYEVSGGLLAIINKKLGK